MASEINVDEGQGQATVKAAPLVFFRESDLFGDRRPTKDEWLMHAELYNAIATNIDASHITGLQRVRGMWRIYLDNVEDKVTLMAEGVSVRGKVVQVLNTNPNRLDNENTVSIRVKNIPLSVDDGIITRALTLRHLDVISCKREKLRINGKLTNCSTGDRLVTVKSTTLVEPLPNYINFGQFVGRCIHPGQNNPARITKCTKCLQDGHKISQCPNEWLCKRCKQSGHKQAECDVDVGDCSDNEHSLNDTVSGEHLDISSEQSPAPQQKKSPTQGSSPSKNTDNRRKLQKSRSCSRSRTHNISNQALIDRFIEKGETPNKPRATNTQDRSPPTPVEKLHERVSEKSKKRNK